MSSENTPRFFVIAGPTASGKSEIAVRVAEQCNGEIVGADAFQVYAGLDILTAKPEPELRARVPHHLIGEVPLTESFDVAQFVERARAWIEEIRSRGKRPIVCGGTGLYIRSLMRGLAELPPANEELRLYLEGQAPEVLQSRLAELDPVAFAQVDLQNPRRVIRAMEVCLLTGRPFSSFRTEWERGTPAGTGVFLHRKREELLGRISRRTAAMFTAGVEEEVRAAGEVGATASQAIGFREIQELLAGRMQRIDCIAAIELATRQYAKRQMTWFRRESALQPIEISAATAPEPLIATLAKRASEEIANC